MSLLQRTQVYQKADHKHPAFRPSGVVNSELSEVTEIDEDVRILNVPDDELERAAGTLWLNGNAADAQVITKYVDSEKWCGDQRSKYAVVKVGVTAFILAVISVTLALVLVSEIGIGPWAVTTNERVPASTPAGIDPLQMMVNAKDLPSTKYVDYTFVFN